MSQDRGKHPHPHPHPHYSDWREGLTTRQIEWLEQAWHDSGRRRWASATYPGQMPKDEEAQFLKTWALEVLDYEVNIKPGGRAIVHNPAAEVTCEIQWLQRKRGVFVPTKVALSSDAGIPASHLGDTEIYVAAFLVEAARHLPESFKRAPRQRPRPGQAPNIDFYRSILEAHAQLIAEGHRNPAAILAERMNTNPETVRSWVHRARRHLASQSDSQQPADKPERRKR